MNDEPTRRQVAAAFEMSVELLERVGGRHNLTAAFLRRQLAETAASRLRHRDAAIVALRRQWLPHESTLAAARTIARDLARYAASAWKRRDRAFAEPPESYRGTPYELAFRIVALSGAKLPGAAAVRKILDAAGVDKIVALETSSRLLLDSSRDRSSAPMFVEETAIAATLEAVPEFTAARKRAAESKIEERRRHLAAIGKLDAEAAKAWKGEEAKKGAAIAKMHAAERELRQASAEMEAVVGAVAADRRARETARREHEGALIAGQWPEIDAFVDMCLDEQARTAKQVTALETVSRNARTGRVEREIKGNSRSVRARLAAIRESMRAAPDLRLLADTAEIPARLEAMKAGWPKVDDVAPATLSAEAAK